MDLFNFEFALFFFVGIKRTNKENESKIETERTSGAKRIHVNRK